MKRKQKSAEVWLGGLHAQARNNGNGGSNPLRVWCNGFEATRYSVISGFNPIGGALLTGVDYGVNEAGNLRDKGVKPEVATKAGITSGVMTAGGLLLPGAAPAESSIPPD